ncbi:MAG: hypothetical protein CMJ78_00495 [Planctomycetaceae bacterium]|nr:hypothetical protein [Planctomycetaceae bacterium]
MPALLVALGITECPEIDDDPDPDIGLSWALPQTGIDISFDSGRVSTVFLYGPSKRQQDYYRGQLPKELDWEMSFDTVGLAHGTPSRHSHGDRSASGPLGPLPPWVRYDGDDHCVHIQFTTDKCRIEMVTIMTAERAP